MARSTRGKGAAGSTTQSPSGKGHKPEDLQMGGRINVTGIATSPFDASERVVAADGHANPKAGAASISSVRAEYVQDSEPIGTVPPPVTVKEVGKTLLKGLKGERAAVLLDKVGERLAFERTGTRLYEGVIGKLDAAGGFPGGPSRRELARIRDQELQHFELLEDAMKQLGGDPTAVTPSADLAAMESMGVLQVITDPRTTVAQCLHAALVAELVDRDGWLMLIDLAEGLGYDDLAARFREAEATEEEHLAAVREWLSVHTSAMAGVKPS